MNRLESNSKCCSDCKGSSVPPVGFQHFFFPVSYMQLQQQNGSSKSPVKLKTLRHFRMVGSLIRLVDRKFRMEMECVQQAMELILDILLYRIVHRSIWISFSNCFPSDSYLFSFNHRRGFAKMTEFAAFFSETR